MLSLTAPLCVGLSVPVRSASNVVDLVNEFIFVLIPLFTLTHDLFVGHLARECTVPGFVSAFRGRGGFGGAFGGRPRPPVNPDGTPVKCYRCNGENHLARDCLAPRDEAAILASKKCYKCQETGHIAR